MIPIPYKQTLDARPVFEKTGTNAKVCGLQVTRSVCWQRVNTGSQQDGLKREAHKVAEELLAAFVCMEEVAVPHAQRYAHHLCTACCLSDP